MTLTQQQKIRRKWQKIVHREDVFTDMIYRKTIELQSQCTHPDVIKHYHSNTGNYDKTVDCYWTVFNCPDCGKQWNEDQ